MSTKPAIRAAAKKNKTAATTASDTAAGKPAATPEKPAPQAAPAPVVARKTAAAPVKKVADAAPVQPVNAAAAPVEKAKTGKIKMERDSFTIPRDEYAQIAILKKRLEALGKPVKKSELLRAGLKLLAAMDDHALQTAVIAVPIIKTGRPKK